MEVTDKLTNAIIEGIQEKKGYDITVVDLATIEGTICNKFIICQGNSPSQVEAIADSIEEFARVKGGEKPVNIVGLGLSQWVAMDYVDVIVHIFLPDTREYYNIENLWEDAGVINIPNLD
ncbi:MAG: ribosome silencing factor [Prevotella sp.]|nr:ribosome silencing factor [Prevotella sp.]MBQ8629706.1 ribosome silencing factor [Prevotella sp.]